MAVVKTGTLSSIIHNNEVGEEIVKWGNANGYPLKKAKLNNAMNGYVGFAENYFIKATRQPPIPGGWDVVVESFEPEVRIIPLNVINKETGELNRFIVKMIKEYEIEGLKMELADKWYDSYGTTLRDLKVTGHKVLINTFEDFIENMR